MRARALLLVLLAIAGCARSELRAPRDASHASLPTSSYPTLGQGELPAEIISSASYSGRSLEADDAKVASVNASRGIFGRTFDDRTIEALEGVFGAPLEETLEPYLGEIESDYVALLQLRDVAASRLPSAIVSAEKALLEPSEELARELKNLRAEHDAAVAEDDETTFKAKRAELWRTYRAGFAKLEAIAAAAMADVLLEGTALHVDLPGAGAFALAKKAGVDLDDATVVFAAAAKVHVRRRAVRFLAASSLDTIIAKQHGKCAAYVKFS
jgi:hypothetical protein